MLSKMKESCHVDTKNQERIPVLVCANIDVSKNMPLLVNGKQEKQRYFKHVKSLLCKCKHNNSAWITSLYCIVLYCIYSHVPTHPYKAEAIEYRRHRCF
jgi:hypothetical protein